MDPLRGEIWWVVLDPTVGSEIAKTRPCVILSDSLVNQHRRTVVVVPLSSSPSAAPPIQVAVTCEGQSAIAVTDQIRAIAKQRLIRRSGLMDAGELERVEDGLLRVLDLS